MGILRTEHEQAWAAVMNTLTEGNPDWLTGQGTGIENAVAEIHRLAEAANHNEHHDHKEGEGVEWGGKGVPPAGTVCRIEEWAPTGEWILCDFDYRIDYVGHSHVVATTVGTSREVERVFTEVRFIPLKSHRDKVIEAVKEVFSGSEVFTVGAIYERLLRVDMLKLPGDPQ